MDVLRELPTVVCPKCGQFHQVTELRRCGCGWEGVALPTPPNELPLILSRTLDRRRQPLEHELVARDLLNATELAQDEAESAYLARWRALAFGAGLDYVTASFAGACGVCKISPRSPSTLLLRVSLTAPPGILPQTTRELFMCPFCLLQVTHDLVNGGPL